MSEVYKKLRKEDFFIRINETFPQISLKSSLWSLEQFLGTSVCIKELPNSTLPSIGTQDDSIWLGPRSSEKSRPGALPLRCSPLNLSHPLFWEAREYQWHCFPCPHNLECSTNNTIKKLHFDFWRRKEKDSSAQRFYPWNQIGICLQGLCWDDVKSYPSSLCT